MTDVPLAIVFVLLVVTAVLVRLSRHLLWPRNGRALAFNQSLDELNLLIDGAADYAIYMLDPQGRVTIWNKGAERLKGWTEAEAIGQELATFYPPEAVAVGKPAADLERARIEGRVTEEDWGIRKDGSRFLANISLIALYDERHRLRGFGKVIRDVTEQRAAERKLLSSAAQMESILSTVPDAMIVIDARGGIISFSAAAEQLFGYKEEEIYGSNISRLMPSPDHERHDGYLERYLATGVRHIIGVGRIVIGRKRDGSTFPLELAVGEAEVEGEPIFTGFIRDLTDKVQTEQRIEEMRSGLIHVARVSAMGTMASTLAHELNQPITAVMNYVETVRDMLVEPDPAEFAMIREALEETASEAMRAGQIVRRLRDFVARGEVEKTVQDLPALIDEAAKLALVGAREQGVTVRFDLDPEATPVLVDRIQIQQVLINLIRNGIEAMAESPRRELTVTTRPEAGGMVCVTIKDTGPGVAAEVAADLFRAFKSTKPEGMGLGLSICRTIVEANGGRIWHEPVPGGGALFQFSLVRIQAEDQHG
jgi:two-component system, LuxR family, sensor kinase FixL